MDPSSANPDVIYQILLLILALANGLGALGTFISAVKGRPAVKRDEFDEHKTQVFARLGGLNDKVNEAAAKHEEQLAEILKELRTIAHTIGIHQGKLEGMGHKP